MIVRNPNKKRFTKVDWSLARSVNTLKRDLHNQGITLTMRVAEHKKGERILTRREQYELMEKENPSVAKLREIFDLNLA